MDIFFKLTINKGTS